MSDYTFELPYPPSVNACWRVFNNRSILSKRGREYRADAIKAMQSIGLGNEMLTERLQVHLTLHPPTLRKYDIDNFCKATFDALSHAGFWEDDEQIDSLSIKKAEKIKGGKVIIKVTKL
ncbi:endodeoxyribonuclease [Vibrio phage 1.112.O._10N.286.46.B11]|nr:endodeoxyribonuclease [Vibrio phage 1.112.O._10N.286.46.B11]